MAEAAYIKFEIEVARPQITAPDPDPLAELASPISVVTSWNSRQGVVIPAASDYDASQVDNDSGVTGAFVSDALDTLDAGKVNGKANLTTQYRMVYVNSAGTVTESSTIVTDASGDLNVTGNVALATLQFDTAYTETGSEPIGTDYWDDENKTITTVLEGGVKGQRFEESFIVVQNDTGVALVDGSVATYAGTIGASGNIRVAPTVAAAAESPLLTIGIVTSAIANGARGFVTTQGKVRGIQTDGVNYGEVWANGDVVYKSGTIAGGLTNVEPNAPIPAIPMAIVVVAHATNGTLLVRPEGAYSLQNMTDVNGTALTVSGQIVVWDQASGYFDFTDNINNYVLGSGLTTQYRMTYVNSAGTLAESSTIVTDASGYLNAGDVIIGGGAKVGTEKLTVNGGTAYFSDSITVDGQIKIHDGGDASNTFVGASTATAITSAVGSVAMGQNALRDLTSGGYNIAIGSASLQNMETGSNNIAIGYGVLANATTSSTNVGIGHLALQTVSTGTLNFSMGDYALNAITTGSNNIAVGSWAGRYYTGGIGLTNASNSVFLGYRTYALADGSTNEIVIGSGLAGNGSNTVTIGNSSITDNYLRGKTITTGATPTIALRDSDCTDSDDNATIVAAATDIGTGTEDIDVTFNQQIAGTLTPFLTADADGDITFGTGRDVNISGNVTANVAHACAYVSTASATSTITSGVPRNLFENANITTGDVAAVDFTVDDTGKQIDYTGTATKNFSVSAIISMTASVSTQTAYFYVAKNGTYIANSQQQRKIGTGADVGNCSVSWNLSLATTDTVEIYCDLTTNGTITAQKAFFCVREII